MTECTLINTEVDYDCLDIESKESDGWVRGYLSLNMDGKRLHGGTCITWMKVINKDAKIHWIKEAFSANKRLKKANIW